MLRDPETGRFTARTNVNEDVKKQSAETEAEKLEREIKERQAQLNALKKAEAEKLAAEKKKAEEEKSLARKAEVAEIQEAANDYLRIIEKNKKIRNELANEENDAYHFYQRKLNDFAEKYNGYHLTYSCKDGKTVEFKVEDARANSFEEIYKEGANLFKNFWNNFLL